jgi:hypothetical protein
MNYIELVKLADVVLRDKFSWKRFIDGTPLVNDLPFYMADFAVAAVAQEREACAKIAEIAEPYKCADLIRARGAT